MSRNLLPLAIALAWASLPLYAQNASLSGVVLDQQGTLIPTADVELRNVDTGSVRNTQSSPTGQYLFPGLAPGSYSLRVHKEGFRVLDRTGITVTASSVIRLDVTLGLGDVTQTVTVQAEAPALQETAEIGKSVTRVDFDRLPLIQNNRIRTPVAFVFLAPGVLGTQQVTGIDNQSASNQILVNGANIFTTELWIDGLPGGPGYQSGNLNESAPAVDAVREFRLITAQLGAEYGNTGSSVASFAIRSGTNDYHGVAYHFLRNDKLDARSFLAARRPTTRQNEFGGVFGGPVRIPRLYNGRDRTFFFFSFGGSRKRGVDTLTVSRIPTPDNITGNFSGLVNSAGQNVTLYDPSTTRPGPNNTLVRDAFPENRIPASSIDPVAAKLAALYPKPNRPSPTLNYGDFTGEKILDPDSMTAKGDHNITNNQRLSLTMVRSHIPRVRPDTPLPQPLIRGLTQTITGWTSRAGLVSVFRPSLISELNLGYNRFDVAGSPAHPANDWARKLGFTGPVFSGFMPQFNFGDGYVNVGDNGGSHFWENVAMVKDQLIWTRGGHTLKFGGEYRDLRLNFLSFNNSSGTYNFSNIYTANLAAPANTGDSFASFLLGLGNRATIDAPFSFGLRRGYTGMFVQDEWRVSPTLTLTLGMRWEMELLPYEQYDRFAFIDLELPNPGAGNLPGALAFIGDRGQHARFASQDYSSWGPRIGAAWRPAPHMVLRGGYGVYYGQTYICPTWTFCVTATGFAQHGELVSNGSLPANAVRLADGIASLTGQSKSATLLNGSNGTFYPQGVGAMPRIQQWSIGWQHELPRGFLVETSYVGVHNTRQVGANLTNANQLSPQYWSLGSLLQQDINSTAARQANIPIPFSGFKGTVAQALRPFPQYQTLTAQSAKEGRSNYNAWQIRFRKQLADLTMEANYTWSRNLGYNTGGQVAFGGVNTGPQNAFQRELEYSLMPNDVPHAFVAHYVYELPFGRAKRWLNQGGLLNVLAGGWSLTGIHRYQSGFPLFVTMSNGNPFFTTALRPNLVDGQPLTTGTSVGDFNPTDARINRAAFAAPTPFQIGNAAPAYADLRQFAVLNEDFAVTKAISFREKVRLELMGQFLNAFNRHRFVDFDTNWSSPNFGKARGVSVPRFIQIGTRLQF